LSGKGGVTVSLTDAKKKARSQDAGPGTGGAAASDEELVAPIVQVVCMIAMGILIAVSAAG
jgi:hypothetical protein